MIERFNYNGSPIRDEGAFLCLTDMWRASGSDPNRRPAEWLRSKQAQEFADFLAENLAVGISHSALVSTESGGEGGAGATWGHWQLALAYAKYLSPAFHAWCNDVVRKVMAGELPSAPVDVAALVRDVVAQVVPAVLQVVLTAIDQRIDEKLARVDYGRVRSWECAALKRRVNMAARSSVLAKAYKNERSARAGLWMRVRTATGWTGTGASLEKMPAHLVPYAEREVAAIEREFHRADNVRQLRLGDLTP